MAVKQYVSPFSPATVPRWSTVLLLGFLLLLFGGLVGVLLAIALLLVRARSLGRTRYEDLPELPEGSDVREIVPLGRRSTSVVLLVIGVDLVGLLLARYFGAGFDIALESLRLDASPRDEGILRGMDRMLVDGLPFMALALVFMAIGGRYTRRLADRDTNMLSMRSAVGAGIVELLRGWSLGSGELPVVAASWTMALMLLPIATICSRSMLAGLGLLEHTLVLVGAPARASRVLDALRPRQGQAILRVDAPATALPPRLAKQLEALTSEEIQNLQVVLCPEVHELETALEACRAVEARGVPCSISADLGVDGRDGLEGEAVLLDGVLHMQGALRRVRPLSALLKRLVDIVGALVGLFVFLPVALPLGLLVIRDGGSLLFAHERVGRHGRRFKCLKLRSMKPDAQRLLKELLERDASAREEWNRDFKLKEDPRITRLGEFMRRTSLDELPQFLNVLKGDMSLVGPRPIVPRELELYYGRDAAAYMSVKPGITGLWQISGRNDLTYPERVALDVEYGRSWSIASDFMIMIRTVEIVVYGRGAY